MSNPKKKDKVIDPKTGSGYQPTKKFQKDAKTGSGVFNVKPYKGSLIKSETGKVMGYKSNAGKVTKITGQSPSAVQGIMKGYEKDKKAYESYTQGRKSLKKRVSSYSGVNAPSKRNK